MSDQQELLLILTLCVSVCFSLRNDHLVLLGGVVSHKQYGDLLILFKTIVVNHFYYVFQLCLSLMEKYFIILDRHFST